MNAAMKTHRDEMKVTYAVDFSRDRAPSAPRNRFREIPAVVGTPTQDRSTPCRPSKRWTWTSGRSARTTSLRAFAGALAMVLVSVASSVSAVTIDMKVIGNPGNAGNPGSSPAGLGSVAYVYQMATTETTNTDYVTFLNTVDPTGTSTSGIYNTDMTQEPFGGIENDQNRPNGLKYAVKLGTAPNGATYTSMPVNFINWFSAARFVNWLENGQTSDPLDLEVGTYTLLNVQNGPLVARNPGSTFFLPSADEWYKAAFFDGTTYTTYQTNSNTAPTATVVTSTPNAANFGGVSAGPLDVGSYVNDSTSAYGLVDMLGNVNEITDTATVDQYRAMGGGFAGILSFWDANATPTFQDGSWVNPNYGFRIAAVPEPATVALAGAGFAGLAGLTWMRRRNQKAGSVLA